jgi:hypothetical protein
MKLEAVRDKKQWNSPTVEQLGVAETLSAPIANRFERTQFGPNDFSQPGFGSIRN